MILFLALCCIAPAALVGYFLESAALGPVHYAYFQDYSYFTSKSPWAISLSIFNTNSPWAYKEWTFW